MDIPSKTLSWRLDDWNAHFAYKANKPHLEMSKEEIAEHIDQLRNAYYPKPADCPGERCPVYRPACKIGVCVIAIRMCGDF